MQRGNPIHVGTGNKYQLETDYSGFGVFPLSFQRYYNSTSAVKSARLGKNWRGTFDRAIAFAVDPAFVTIYRPDGKAFDFHQSGGIWSADADIVGHLEQITGGWRYTNPQDEVETYDAAGKLVAIANRNGVGLTLAYDAAGRLLTVTDPVGRTLTFSYDANDRVVSMTDPAGGIYAYAYDAAGNLASATYPDATPGDLTDNPQRTYLYNESAYTSGTSLPNALTGLVDETGQRFATWSYDTQGRAISSEHGVGIDKITVSYVANSNGSGASTVTDALGNVRTTNFQSILGVSRNVGESQPGGSGCGAASSLVTHDANGNVASRTDFNGNQTAYAYDLARNLETSRTEGLTSSGVATPQTRTISTAWHSSFRLPATITEPGRVSSYSYDTQGNLTQKSVRDTATNASRTWNWSYTYSTLVPGLMAQKVEDGPRTDVSDLTTTDYYAPDAYCTGGHNGCRGQISQISNALGHATRISRYNAHGQPEEIVDPNGLVTTLAYDARQRLTSRTSGSERTDYQYDGVGQLVRITRPDGSALNYTYDAAHRLVGIADTLGNAIAYTLDPMGNRVKEDVRDPLGQLAQTRSREFDALNRLYRDIGAAGQATTYAYDAQGNLKQVTDPLLHSTGNNYDALNRLIQINDPAGSQTQQAHDALDRIVSVTDPKGVVTTYTYNGLGDLLSEVSADRGTTNYTYDSAGNLLTRTDARGVKHTYTYDALNRPTQRVHTTVTGIPNTASLNWSYDTGSNGIGRLTGMTDESGSTVFAYDPHGRLLNKTQTTKLGNSSFTHSLGYGYDTSGRLIQQTYPSGAQLNTTYGSDSRSVAIQVNGAILISNIVYQPFGAPKAWTWGNGTPYTRQFDSDGRLNQYPVGSDTRTLGFDAAGRIISTRHANPVFDRYYDYDAADRLAKEIDNIGVSLWAYDLNGNRTSTTLGSNTYAYSYPATSNRLQSVAGPIAKTYTFDAAGNPTSDGLASFTYGAAGRLSRVVRNSRNNIYRYNALGERAIKSGAHLSNEPHRFIYDAQGHLIGEYDNSNQLRQETVWLDDTPIAVLKKDTQGQTQVHYVHADHLNTPRAILDSQNRMVWRWYGDAFGQNRPEEDPDGDGKAFEYNLRFPGQYYDQETGLHYNYFRDYDSSTGRYVQSDPIGLAGGLNVYSYALNNPLSYTDPTGEIVVVDDAVIIGATLIVGACIATNCTKPISNAIGNAVNAVKELCSDDDDINCDEWVKNLNMAYAQISVFKRAGGNTRLAELQHNKSVNILCNDPDCGHLCSKVNRF